MPDIGIDISKLKAGDVIDAESKTRLEVSRTRDHDSSERGD